MSSGGNLVRVSAGPSKKSLGFPTIVIFAPLGDSAMIQSSTSDRCAGLEGFPLVHSRYLRGFVLHSPARVHEVDD